MAYEIDPNDPRRHTYLDMVRLVNSYGFNDFPTPPGIAADAMQLAICWEESTWMNIAQVTKSGKTSPDLAVGFGQIEPSALQLVINRFKFSMRVADYQRLIGASALSIGAVGRVLRTIADNLTAQSEEATKKGDWKHVITNMPGAALNGYATNASGNRTTIIKAWLACAEGLSKKTLTVNGLLVASRDDAKEALWKGLPVGMVDGKMINRRPWPPVWAALMDSVLTGLP